jgi:hypothetical protein
MFANLLLTAALAFSAPVGNVQSHRSAVVSSPQMALSRRELAVNLAGSALLFATPLSALADGASTTITRQKAAAVYGTRILKIDEQLGPNSALVESLIKSDINAFTLFISSARLAMRAPRARPLSRTRARWRARARCVRSRA